MEFIGFQVVDIITVGLILFLAIRGLINGFSKELFKFLALIGGIAIAARTHKVAGEFIAQQNILPKLSPDFQNLVAFIAVFILIFILFNMLSSIRAKFRTEVPGFFSRILGYLISIVRYVFIFSLIIFGISNADFLKERFEKYYEDTILFEPMVHIGETLLNAKKKTVNENNDTNASDNNVSVDLNITLTDHNE